MAGPIMTDREDWPFDQAPNVAALTTVNVLERGAPILRVRHYADDDSWAFVCGLTNDEADARVIGMRTALRIDPSLREIADLPPGWTAWRQHIGAVWHRVPDAAEDSKSGV